MLARIKVWGTEVLYAADLNAEFNNILTNAMALISPWTGHMDAGGFRLSNLGLGTSASTALQAQGATGTGVYFGSTSRVDFANNGARVGGFNTGILQVGASTVTAGAFTGDIILGAGNALRFLNQAQDNTALYGLASGVGNVMEYHVPDGTSVHRFVSGGFTILDIGTLGNGVGGYLQFNGKASVDPIVPVGKGALYLYDDGGGNTQLRFSDGVNLQTINTTVV